MQAKNVNHLEFRQSFISLSTPTFMQPIFPIGAFQGLCACSVHACAYSDCFGVLRASIPLSQWCIWHIPPIFKKFINVPLFPKKFCNSPLFQQNLGFLDKFTFFASPYYDHHAFMHRALHALETLGSWGFSIIAHRLSTPNASLRLRISLSCSAPILPFSNLAPCNKHIRHLSFL